jgi:hypothetical protein
MSTSSSRYSTPQIFEKKKVPHHKYNIGKFDKRVILGSIGTGIISALGGKYLYDKFHKTKDMTKQSDPPIVNHAHPTEYVPGSVL